MPGNFIIIMEHKRKKILLKMIAFNGKSTTWFDNANVSQENFYKQGKLEGEIKTYFYSGSPKTIEHYTDDLKNGKSDNYTFDGFLNRTSDYKNNNLQGETKFFL